MILCGLCFVSCTSSGSDEFVNTAAQPVTGLSLVNNLTHQFLHNGDQVSGEIDLGVAAASPWFRADIESVKIDSTILHTDGFTQQYNWSWNLCRIFTGSWPQGSHVFTVGYSEVDSTAGLENLRSHTITTTLIFNQSAGNSR